MRKLKYILKKFMGLIKPIKRDFALDDSNAGKFIKLMELGKDVSSKGKMREYVSFCKENSLLLLIEGKPSINMGILMSWLDSLVHCNKRCYKEYFIASYNEYTGDNIPLDVAEPLLQAKWEEVSYYLPIFNGMYFPINREVYSFLQETDGFIFMGDADIDLFINEVEQQLGITK